jgi:hypothetical protein
MTCLSVCVCVCVCVYKLHPSKHEWASIIKATIRNNMDSDVILSNKIASIEFRGMLQHNCKF